MILPYSFRVKDQVLLLKMAEVAGMCASQVRLKKSRRKLGEFHDPIVV